MKVKGDGCFYGSMARCLVGRLIVALLAVSLLPVACGGHQQGVPSDDLSDTAADGSPDSGDPIYLACGDGEPCEGDFECVLGLCIPRCDGGPACVEGEVCWPDEGCLEQCDETRSCTQAFTCVEGTCEDDPCGHPEFWPLSLESLAVPAIVHYRHAAEREVAEEVLGYLEFSWTVETVDLGFEPPLPDQGLCGPDDRFDVFVWRSYRGGSADAIGPNEETPWDDAFTYLILDPWGPYGGERLDATVAHELNHAMQAVDDWNEHGLLFEMTSQTIEELVYGADDGYQALLFDFQSNPDWAFDYNDDWDTWYWYGTALYAMYLQKAVFGGDAAFLSAVWRACRNEPGDNEPDFEDAFDSVLGQQAGMTFVDSLVPFSRWRYFTSTRDDGRHFDEGAAFPEDALVAIEREISATPGTVEIEPGPMLLGVNYLVLTRPAGAPESIGLAFEGDPDVRWSLQVVPGLEPGSDGEVLEVGGSDETVEIHFGSRQDRTLIVLALPPDGTDPEERTEERFAYTIQLADVGGSD